MTYFALKGGVTVLCECGGSGRECKFDSDYEDGIVAELDNVKGENKRPIEMNTFTGTAEETGRPQYVAYPRRRGSPICHCINALCIHLKVLHARYVLAKSWYLLGVIDCRIYLI